MSKTPTGMSAQQQLVARIKKTSKYSHQAPEGRWFDVTIENDSLGYALHGNNNDYRRSDVVFGVRLETGEIVELKP